VISHPHKTIFVHIPKCGGQSIESCFLEDLGLDWESRAPLLLRPNKNPRNGPPRLAHLCAREYIQYWYATPEMFASYYTFALLRDPVDRALSIYNYLAPKRYGRRISFDRFLGTWLPEQLGKAGRAETRGRKFYFVRPQVDFVLDANGEVMVQDLILLDRLADHYPRIAAKAGLRSPLGHQNKSTKTVTRKDLTPAHHDAIREMYAADFDLIARQVQQDPTPDHG